jgi:hypothetical protein
MPAGKIGRAGIQHLALLDEVVHGPHHFLYRNIHIWPVTEIKIKVINLQPSQCIMTCFKKMLAAKACLVRLIILTPQPKKCFR